MRHCAYCLISVPSERVAVCAKCKRRAYCSKECQKKDWSPNGKGQGHKIWCALQCGEEDLDWEVAPVSGKGLGLIAKRPLPSKFRIMVETVYPKDSNHPGIQDLMPQGGSTEEKFKLNCLQAAISPEEMIPVICLRISRANHKCLPNAGHVYESKLKVKILYAERDIEEGEEICIDYVSYNNLSRPAAPSEVLRIHLKTTWGIICHEDCFCRDKAIEKLISESKSLYSSILEMGSEGNTQGALDSVNILINNQELIHSSWIEKRDILFTGYQFGTMKNSTLKLGEEFGKKWYELWKEIAPPDTLQLKGYLLSLKYPMNNPNYLFFERR